MVPALPGLEILVGWDRPLQTFWAQVWDLAYERDQPEAELAWVGCTPREITDPQDVVDTVAHWAKRVPADLVEKLTDDAEAQR